MTNKRIITILLIEAVLLLALPITPVNADDEASTDAEVEVVPAGGMSYGAKVVDSHSTLLPVQALGEPDSQGAVILLNGWISLELKDNVSNTTTISVWAANGGWQSSNMKVYVSADGKKWKQAGREKVESGDFQRYDFTGSFGNVKYIKVERSGGLLSWLRLDAVGAKGGDESN